MLSPCYVCIRYYLLQARYTKLCIYLNKELNSTTNTTKMRLSQLISAALLPLTALAAKKTPAERFSEAHAKPQPIKLDDRSYEALTKAPRDYSVAVLLTAMDASQAQLYAIPRPMGVTSRTYTNIIGASRYTHLPSSSTQTTSSEGTFRRGQLPW